MNSSSCQTMRSRPSAAVPMAALTLAVAFASSPALGDDGANASRVALAPVAGDSRSLYFGGRLRAGGRYDNVRACVATPAGVPGGPAGDVSFLTKVGLHPRIALDIDLPVMRPILFAAAFEMLQYEPSVTLELSRPLSPLVDFIAGPTLGLSLHYGPDYESENSGPGRTASFFALGPMMGAHFALAFEGERQRIGTDVGLSPYVTPLFGIDDPHDHRGVVAGGMLDISFRFRAR